MYNVHCAAFIIECELPLPAIIFPIHTPCLHGPFPVGDMDQPLSSRAYGVAGRLNLFNHCPHFSFFMTHFTDSMPISSIGGIWSADLWNSKYMSHVSKVSFAVDMSG